MRNKTLKPAIKVSPEDLPVLFYEAKALRLHADALRLLTRRLGQGLMTFWLNSTATGDRVSRFEALHPDRPKAEVLRDLGLQRFLNTGIAGH